MLPVIRDEKMIAWLASATALLAAGALIAYAGWSDPPSLAPQGSVAGIINTSSAQQTKKGGLQVNTLCDPVVGTGCPQNQTGIQAGLIVDGDPLLGTGKVGIGTFAPTEQLEVVGNMIVNGYLRLEHQSSINFPDDGEVLTWIEPAGATPYADWTPDLSWMTIQRIDMYDPGRGCVTVFPVCPAGTAWLEYSVIQSGDLCAATQTTPFVTMNDYRTCYQDFSIIFGGPKS